MITLEGQNYYKNNGNSSYGQGTYGTWTNSGSMNKMKREYKFDKNSFTDGDKLYHILDLSKGTLKIFNKDHKLMATSTESLKGKKVAPLVNMYY